jgi:hypothetical protein
LVKLFTVKVTGGGVGKIFKVAVTLQPNGSKIVIVVIPTGNPVALREFPAIEPGVGLQLMVAPTDAEPAQVIDAADNVFVQPGCVADATNIGAGVIVTVITLIIGAHDPGGFIVN